MAGVDAGTQVDRDATKYGEATKYGPDIWRAARSEARA
jgi:hypothetical protein